MFKNSRGATFIIVMVMSMLMIFIGVAGSNMLLQDVHIVKYLKRSAQAQQIAEAGIGDALATILTSGLSESTSNDNELGAGEYDVIVDQNDTNERWLVISTGTVDSTARTVAVEVDDLYPDAMENSLSAGTDITLKANSGDITVKGDMHANNKMTLSEVGAGCDVRIEAWAAEGKTGKVTCSGGSAQYKVEAGVFIADSANSGYGKPQLNTPVFNFADFKDVAQSSGTYVAPAQTPKTYTNTTISGGTASLTYVDGNVSFTGTCTIVGGFVAKGSITLNSGHTLVQEHADPNRFPILMSKEGNRIKLYGTYTTTEDNVMFATNNIQIETPDGVAAMYGCIVAGGSFSITANKDLTITYGKITADDVVPGEIDVTSWNR